MDVDSHIPADRRVADFSEVARKMQEQGIRRQNRSGAPPPMTAYIIACMPVAISCSILTERFGGDTLLAARSTFYSTLWSILTVPAFYYVIRLWGL